MNSLTLKSSWRYAFSLFKWTELKLIIFSSLLTTKRAIKHILLHGGLATFGALALIIPLSIFVTNFALKQALTSKVSCFPAMTLLMKTTLIPLFLLSFLLIFTAIYSIPMLAIRTSHARKDFLYYWSYRTINLIFFSLILLFLSLLFGALFKPLSTLSITNSPVFQIAYSLLIKPVTTAFWLGSTFFFLDAPFTLNIWQATKWGIINGFKMATYFTPIFLFPWQFALSTPFIILGSWVKTHSPQINAWRQYLLSATTSFHTRIGVSICLLAGAFIIMALFITLMYSFYATLYLKLKHNHHDFFFEQNKTSQRNEVN